MVQELNAAYTKLWTEFEINAERLKDLVTPLSDRQIYWRPQYDTWSILDILFHINTTNQNYLENIGKKLTAAQKSEKPLAQNAQWTFLGRFFLYLMEPPHRLRFKAPSKLVRGISLSREEIFNQFQQTHVGINALLKEAPHYDLSKLRFYTPATRRLSWNFVEIVSLLAAHERRHLWQAERIVSLTQFPQD